MAYLRSYAIYSSAYPTAVNIASNTFTAADVSGIGATHTLDQVLAYNSDFFGIYIYQSRNIGRQFGGGIYIQNTGSSTSPAFGLGVAVSGNYACAYCVQTSGEEPAPLKSTSKHSRAPQAARPPSSTHRPPPPRPTTSTRRACPDGSTANVFAVNPNTSSASAGLDIFGSALTIGAAGSGVAINANPSASDQFLVNVASGESFGIVDAEATGPLCNGCSCSTSTAFPAVV